ncbi:Uncharacterised protein [Mycobacteroides abscessus subsp. abscessus]|nr:Uncharacterised protein [Mycobacteroides abscessus subsp. abscessus]
MATPKEADIKVSFIFFSKIEENFLHMTPPNIKPMKKEVLI